jgi:hypothetical protein
MANVSGFKVFVNTIWANLFSWPTLIVGQNGSGFKLLQVDAAGNMIVSGLGSGAVGTYHGFTVPVSQTAAAAIPTTAKRWSLLFRSASGTISYGNSYQDGVNVSVTSIGPVSSYNDNAAPVTAITVTTDANTVCDVLYSTT